MPTVGWLTPISAAMARSALLLPLIVGDIVEIGRRLTEAKAIAGHGNWLPWLDREFGWTDKTALNFMQVHAMVGKSEKFSDLDLPVSGLYLLAAPSTLPPCSATMNAARGGSSANCWHRSSANKASDLI